MTYKPFLSKIKGKKNLHIQIKTVYYFAALITKAVFLEFLVIIRNLFLFLNYDKLCGKNVEKNISCLGGGKSMQVISRQEINTWHYKFYSGLKKCLSPS